MTSEASEYVVVGSGAGGGTVPARLAEAGHTVSVMEAGGDPRMLQGGDPNRADANCLPDDYYVPVFHALSTENDAVRWSFFSPLSLRRASAARSQIRAGGSPRRSAAVGCRVADLRAGLRLGPPRALHLPDRARGRWAASLTEISVCTVRQGSA
jgi:choline dehydrogenase-like flavoprotein